MSDPVLVGDAEPARRRLLVEVPVAGGAAERCNQACTIAATAVAAGVDVSLWLAGEASWFAVPGRASEFVVPHAAPLDALLETILDGGRVTLCTQCAARRDLTQDDLLPGVRIAGAAVFVEEATAAGTQALVY
jgi:predicted peroxiredoxin